MYSAPNVITLTKAMRVVLAGYTLSMHEIDHTFVQSFGIKT
jgi:hypothetical protein